MTTTTQPDSLDRLIDHHTGRPSEPVGPTGSIRIGEFSIRAPEGGQDIIVRLDEDDMPGVFEMGDHHGAVLVRHCADGEYDLVTFDLQRSDPFAVLDRAMETLLRTREQLERMIPKEQREPGQCMTRGDWGRCRGREAHEGAHRFPTEAEWKATQPPRLVKRSA